MVNTPITFPRDARPGPFDPPEIFRKLRDQGPLAPMTFADGHEGWLATGYDVIRAILADNRFSNRRELAHVPVERPGMEEFVGKPAEPGMFLRTDPPEHARYRRPLIAEFTVRRMRQLEPRIAEVVRERLDAMEQAGPPVDLVEEFALPIPSLVICELLGIPYAERGEFQAAMAVLVDWKADSQTMMKAFQTMMAFFPPLIERKRREPTDDLYSDLVNNGDLTDQELTNIGLILFGAGFETTANMLGLGTFALLQHPDQLVRLREDPTLTDAAVEELLRYLTIIHFGPMRTALEDVEIAGVTIAKGQCVLMSLPVANRDPGHFDDPETLDITRSAPGAGSGGAGISGHLSFGHGVHQCLGQQLARVEMRLAFPALFDRFPGLRLAVPPTEVPTKEAMTIYGVKRLPVAW